MASAAVPQLRLSSAPRDVVGMAGADVNGDGTDDLVVSAGTRTLLVRLGNSQGLLAATVTSRGRSGRVRVVADLDADGDRDLVVQPEEYGRPEILLGAGDGRFQAASVLRGAGGATDVAAIDVDRDGRLDLATTRHSGGLYERLRFFRGVGAGRFEQHPVAVTGARRLSAGLLAGDVDGDGFADLVLSAEDGPLLARGWPVAVCRCASAGARGPAAARAR